MKFLTWLFVALPVVLAAPALEEQTIFGDVLGYSNLAGSVFGQIAKGVEHIIHGVEEKVEQEVKQWFNEGKEFVKQDGLVCKLKAQRHWHVMLIGSRRACLPSRLRRLQVEGHGAQALRFIREAILGLSRYC